MQLTRIRTLCEQGYTTTRIAQQLEVPYRMVWRALSRLALIPRSAAVAGRRVRSVSTVSTSSPEQLQLQARFVASKLSVAVLAEWLNTDWRKLSRELRGALPMSAARIVKLDKILPKLPA